MILISLLALVSQQAAPVPEAGPNRYSPAAATIVAEPVAMMVAGFDADGDARITRGELEAGVARSFATANPQKADAIGYIGFGDWAARWLGDANAVPSAFEVDRNGDNRITLGELQDRMGEVFTRMDRDKDGVLTHAELLTIRGQAFGGPGDRGNGERGRERRRGR
jgi:hypothetical protein